MTTWGAGVKKGELSTTNPGSQLAAQIVYDMMRNPKTAGGAIANQKAGRHGGGSSGPVNVRVLNFLHQKPLKAIVAAADSDSPPRSS